MFERKDHFYKKAKKEGFASRAVYKLFEIQKKYRLLKKGDKVLDLGAAPGGWLEIAAKEVGGKGHVVGIDRLPLKIGLPSNATFIQQNIEEEFPKKMEFDVVLSDLSPDLTGIVFKDTYQSYELTKIVWGIAQKYLKENGNLVIKIFPGEEINKLKAEMRRFFKMLKIFVPEATRKTSSEIYLVATGFKKIIGKF